MCVPIPLLYGNLSLATCSSSVSDSIKGLWRRWAFARCFLPVRWSCHCELELRNTYSNNAVQRGLNDAPLLNPCLPLGWMHFSATSRDFGHWVTWKLYENIDTWHLRLHSHRQNRRWKIWQAADSSMCQRGKTWTTFAFHSHSTDEIIQKARNPALVAEIVIFLLVTDLHRFRNLIRSATFRKTHYTSCRMRDHAVWDNENNFVLRCR